jgi:hypothetical protein
MSTPPLPLLEEGLVQRGGVWHVDAIFEIEGERIRLRKTTGRRDLAEARVVKARLVDELRTNLILARYQRENGIVSAAPPTAGRSGRKAGRRFTDAVELYLKSKMVSDIGPGRGNTRQGRQTPRSALGRQDLQKILVLEAHFRREPIAQIDDEDWLDFLVEHQEESMPATKNRWLSVFNAIMTAGCEADKIIKPKFTKAETASEISVFVGNT